MELADTRDLKSLDGDIVPVQVRSAAPCEQRSRFGTQKLDIQISTSFFYGESPEFKLILQRCPLLQKWDMQKGKLKNQNVKIKKDQI